MKYEFQEKGHKHFLDGKRATGVTTILNVIAKPALINWAANMACDYVGEKAKWNDPFLKQEEYEQILKEARNAHRRKKEDAGDIGKIAHKIIEEWIKDSKSASELPKDIKIVTMVNNFINWAKTNKVKFLESEKSVWSEKLFCAGICDFVCEINGEKLVGDIKTSSGIYPEFFYQVAAYRMFLEEMGEKDFRGSVIVNLKKDGSFNENEDVIINYSYEDEKDAFLAAWTLYKVGQGFLKNKFNNKL